MATKATNIEKFHEQDAQSVYVQLVAAKGEAHYWKQKYQREAARFKRLAEVAHKACDELDRAKAGVA